MTAIANCLQPASAAVLQNDIFEIQQIINDNFHYQIPVRINQNEIAIIDLLNPNRRYRLMLKFQDERIIFFAKSHDGRRVYLSNHQAVYYFELRHQDYSNCDYHYYPHPAYRIHFSYGDKYLIFEQAAGKIAIATSQSQSKGDVLLKTLSRYQDLQAWCLSEKYGLVFLVYIEGERQIFCVYGISGNLISMCHQIQPRINFMTCNESSVFMTHTQGVMIFNIANFQPSHLTLDAYTLPSESPHFDVVRHAWFWRCDSAQTLQDVVYFLDARARIWRLDMDKDHELHFVCRIPMILSAEVEFYVHCMGMHTAIQPDNGSSRIAIFHNAECWIRILGIAYNASADFIICNTQYHNGKKRSGIHIS